VLRVASVVRDARIHRILSLGVWQSPSSRARRRVIVREPPLSALGVSSVNAQLWVR
jgi:hypothetical protein